MDEVDSGGAWLQYQSQSELWSVSSSSQEPVNATPFPCSRALPQQSTTVSTWQSSSTSHQHRTDSSESWHTQTTGYYAQCTSDLPTDGYDDVDCAGPTTFASHIGTCAMTDSSSKDEASGTIFINPPQLALLLKAGLEKYLLIDSRSFLEYNTSHIQQSANVCCSKLVKRRLQRDKVHIRDLLTQTCHLDIDEFVDVIVYDQCTERPELLPDDTFLCVLLSKLATTFSRVALLKGGFLAFQAMYPSLCESKTNSYRCAALTSLSQPCLPVSNVGPTRILPFLYLGSQQDALSPDIVQVNEITYILNVSTTCIKPPHIPDGHFLRIPVNDNYSAKLQPYFAEAFQFLDKVREANGCCLVHCLAGISRSPTLAIAYIMKHLHMSSDDAYRYVKDKRPTISPNFNFLGQLLEFEKQMKRELNNNGEGSESRHWSNYVMDLSSHSPSSPVQKTVRPFAFDTSIQPEQSTSKLSMQNVTVERTGIDSCVRDKQSEGLGRSQLCVKRKPEFAFPMTLTGGPSKLLHHGPSVTEPETSVSVHSSPFPSSKESTVRPNVLNLGFDSARRSPPSLSMGLETNLGMSKSLTDIKETSESESPSPSMSSSLHEPLFTTSRVRSKSEYRVKELASPFPCGETTLPGERNLKPMLSPFPCGQHSLPIGDSVSSLMSPFPCGESTVSGTSSELSSPLPCRETTSGFMIEKTKSLTYNEKMTHKPKGCMDQFRMFSGINESGNISKPELLGHVSSVTSDVISGSVGAPHDLSESKSVKPASPSTSADSSFSLSEPLLNVRGKRPLRSSLSLTLSPITPTKTLPVCSSSGEISSLSSSEKYAPSACKIERRIVYGIPQPFTSPNIPEASVHESKSSASSYSCSSSVTVSASHAVKLKSFTFPTASITLPAQSPTSSLARLHFGSTDTSDSDNDNAMDTSGSESTLLNQEQVSGCTNSASSNTCNKELKFYSFPSTSLDKLNFTPCLSNSTDNLVQSPPPRTTGVKRPLNSDVLDLKENSHSSPGSNNSSMASSSNNSSVSSPTTSSGGAQKPTVRKREGRSKRTLVRPSSIAFSTYPTFDLGSDCQDSPHSSGSATSQDDSSESYVQNGKKSKQSEYLSDVRFRLGRYSEREMYRQITAAMETAMLKSQAFEASRKSRSLDDILSSEDDASTPNSPKVTRMNVAPPML